MVRFTGGLLLFSAFKLSGTSPADAGRSLTDRQRILAPEPKTQPAKPRQLHGRFLHITDFHPDPFYTVGSNPKEEVCHRGSGSAGFYGADVSDCDSPFSLVNATFDWVEKNLKDEIDFVVWTGDSARHDNDEKHPRSEKEVVGLNRYLVEKFVDVFGKQNNIDNPDPTNEFIIPIVPTFGNNDILPHNIFQPGPNKWTRKYLDIWEKFVPQEQLHSFARGGWFFTEVIPNKLAVISLNTMYFFDSNSAVDGCDAKSEPGFEHMQWLRIQLQFLRQRGMKAMLMGHVPPSRTESKQSWDESCWQKYTLWLQQYRDVIIGSVYGHSNIDHFMVHDFKDITYKIKNGKGRPPAIATVGSKPRSNETFTTAAKDTYLKELRDAWRTLPVPPRGLSYDELADSVHDLVEATKSKKKSKRDKFLKAIGGQYAERFSLSLVSPSVVPNYFPSLRIVEYNITGLENDHPATRPVDGTAAWEELASDTVEYKNMIQELYDQDLSSGQQQEQDGLHDLKKKKKKGQKKPPSFTVPKPPPKSAPPGPAYSPQTLTLTAYIQYFANLTYINNIVKGAASSKDGNPKPNPFKYEVEYNSMNDTHYQLKDLTMRRYLDLAERIARKEMAKKGESDDKGKKKPKNHVWRAFVKRAFVGTTPEEDLEDKFG